VDEVPLPGTSQVTSRCSGLWHWARVPGQIESERIPRLLAHRIVVPFQDTEVLRRRTLLLEEMNQTCAKCRCDILPDNVARPVRSARRTGDAICDALRFVRCAPARRAVRRRRRPYVDEREVRDEAADERDCRDDDPAAPPSSSLRSARRHKGWLLFADRPTRVAARRFLAHPHRLPDLE
jgi:hypothetical protein